MNSKFLIGIIVILLLIIAGLVFYFAILPQWKTAEKIREFFTYSAREIPSWS